MWILAFVERAEVIDLPVPGTADRENSGPPYLTTIPLHIRAFLNTINMNRAWFHPCRGCEPMASRASRGAEAR